MSEKIQFQSDTYVLKRYPNTNDKSLKAWSNAEIMVLEYCKNKTTNNIHLFNDRFGVWNCLLHKKRPITVCTYASQQKSIEQNIELNELITETVFKTPLDTLNKVDLALIKIPKSLELFELFLKQIHESANEETEVVCGFMLKYFSPSFLKVASVYFDSVTQTKAWRKARLLILKKPKKETPKKDLLNTIRWKGKELKQYYGVFSSGKIDVGTQFFLEDLKILEKEKKVLDLASGNGVIGYEITRLQPDVSLTLVDDFNLAIASSRLNLPKEKTSFICAENLKALKGENFDLVVSNPPFHFEHENNIEITLSLFKEVKDCLKENGRFLVVSNVHLNYRTHLSKLFKKVNVVSMSAKFVIYECY